MKDITQLTAYLREKKEKTRIVAAALWTDFMNKRVMESASQLTYSTLLATVPIVAVIFAIARGFGYNKYIEAWFRSALDSQPQAVEVIIGFVNSYLIHTKSGIVFGFGLVFMLWTVIMLTRNIELVFNDIWEADRQRSLARTFTDFMAMFFMLPIMIIINSGVTLWMASVSKIVREEYVIGPLLKLSIDIMPTVIMTGIFTVLYTFMPNTRVRWRNALVPAFIATLCMQVLQYFYIHSQMWVSGYNAIYGSFAALPLFMLWIQFTWIIILVGAELSYVIQNFNYLLFSQKGTAMSQRYRFMMCAMVLGHICKRMKDGYKPYTASDLCRLTKTHPSIIDIVLETLAEAGLIATVVTKGKEERAYLPIESVEVMTLGKLYSHLENIHPWKYDVSLRDTICNEKWKKAFSLRKDYIDGMNGIKMYELASGS